jgi:hypothetical protein
MKGLYNLSHPRNSASWVILSCIVWSTAGIASPVPQDLEHSCLISAREIHSQSEAKRIRRALDLLTLFLLKKKGIVGVGTNIDDPRERPFITVLVDEHVLPTDLKTHIPKTCLGIPVALKQSMPFRAQ